MDRNDDVMRKVGLAFLAGAATGWLVSIFMPEDTRNKVKNEIEDKTSYLKKVMTDPEERERIKDVFSEKTQNTKEKLEDVKNDIANRLAALKGGAQDIDKRKYMRAVQDSIEDMREGNILPEDELNRLRDYLEGDYERIRRRMRRA
ncbi:MAG: hypothetical protein ACOX6N_02990 [Patescibacteria group bacterium]|jgi:hypothetical protein